MSPQSSFLPKIAPKQKDLRQIRRSSNKPSFEQPIFLEESHSGIYGRSPGIPTPSVDAQEGFKFFFAGQTSHPLDRFPLIKQDHRGDG